VEPLTLGRWDPYTLLCPERWWAKCNSDVVAGAFFVLDLSEISRWSLTIQEAPFKQAKFEDALALYEADAFLVTVTQVTVASSLSLF
jgi:hypothetical protein